MRSLWWKVATIIQFLAFVDAGWSAMHLWWWNGNGEAAFWAGIAAVLWLNILMYRVEAD